MDTRSARSRGVAAIVASLALLGSGAAITGTPAQSAPPAQDCADFYPVGDITRGQVVDGLTVSEGTDPTPFAGEVLGVLKDGIAPGVDMIIADLANPTGNANNDTRIDEVGGIWQGMSGSPVYSEDGRLLGAVAYGLSWGPSTVAGITPYEQMNDYLPGDPAAARVGVPDPMARSIASSSDVTARQASDGMQQLRVPLTINGISQQRLRDMRSDERGDTLHRQGRAGTLIGAAGPGVMADESDIVDGGNLGAAISRGTITAGGVGTVTDRCGDDVVGFGHPMMFSGATTLGLMPADAIYVQEESLGAPFKVANLAAPAGAITQDRLTGITGNVNAPLPETPITSTVIYNDEDPATPQRDGTGESWSMAQEWNADVTLMQMLSMHDVTIDAIQPGSETSSVSIRVTVPGSEEPVTLAMEDRFVSDWDIAIESLWGTYDLLYVLSRIDDIQVTDITTDAKVADSTDTFRLGTMQQRRHGTWVTVNRRHPALVTAGGVLTVRAKLRGPDGSEWLTEQVRVPAKARDEGRLSMVGGSWLWNDGLWEADTVADVQKALADDVRNDEVETRLDFWSRKSDVGKRVTSGPQSLVVEGHKSAKVVVRR